MNEVGKQQTYFGPLASAVGLVYFALSLLSFGGTFHNSADEWLMFAATESLAKWGEGNVDQLFWVGEYMGWARFGSDGHLYVPYSNFSTGQSLIGVPVHLLARLLPYASPAHVTLLTNGVVVSLTLALLVLTLGQLGFSPRVALATVALFGFGSALWPYSKTYFGEPLLGLSFLAVVYCLVRYRKALGASAATNKDGIASIRWSALAGAAVAIALVAKPLGVLIGPFALVYLATVSRRQPRKRLILLLGAFASLPLLVGICIVGLTLKEFGGLGGLQHLHGFGTPLLTGLWGQLLSPGRSVFLYSPVVVLSVLGWRMLYRRERLLGATLGLFLGLYTTVMASWDVWHGGFTVWGPRFLVPLLPVAAIAASPLLADAANRRAAWAFAFALGIAGAAVQLLAVANNYLPVMEEIGRRYPGLHSDDPESALRAFSDIEHAPLLLVWRHFSAERSDLAWLDGRTGVDGIALAVCLLLLMAAISYLVAILRWRSQTVLRLGPPALVIASLVAVSILLPRYASSSRYCPPNYREALARFDRQASPTAALVTLDLAANAYFNYQQSANHRYGLSANDQEPLPSRVASMIDVVARKHSEVWTIGPADRVSDTEKSLRQRFPMVYEWRYDDLRLARIRRLDHSPPSTATPIQVEFAERAKLVAIETGSEFRPGRELQVDLYWQGVRPMDVSYSVSLQLLDPTGKLVSQQDGPPAQGEAPTTAWTVGGSVYDPRVIAVPPALDSGAHRLLVIVYDSATGKRLSLADGADSLVLRTFVVP